LILEKTKEPCCCDEYCEFVESSASRVLVKACLSDAQVTLCENLGKADTDAARSKIDKLSSTRLNRLSAGFQIVVHSESYTD